MLFRNDNLSMVHFDTFDPVALNELEEHVAADDLLSFIDPEGAAVEAKHAVQNCRVWLLGVSPESIGHQVERFSSNRGQTFGHDDGVVDKLVERLHLPGLNFGLFFLEVAPTLLLHDRVDQCYDCIWKHVDFVVCGHLTVLAYFFDHVFD